MPSCRVIAIPARAPVVDDGLPVGDGDREGRRDDPADVVVLPEAKDDRESVRKNGEVVVGSGTPSSSAYKSWEMFAPGTQFWGASLGGNSNVNSNLPLDASVCEELTYR